MTSEKDLETQDFIEKDWHFFVNLDVLEEEKSWDFLKKNKNEEGSLEDLNPTDATEHGDDEA